MPLVYLFVQLCVFVTLWQENISH